MSDDSDPDNKVGYCRPPRHSRFPPGRSGNAAGRPRGSRSLTTLVTAELNKPVAVREGGKVRKLRKREALAASLVNKSLQGDPRATQLLLGILQRTEPDDPTTGQQQEQPLGADDQAILADYRARHGAKDIKDA